MDHLLAQIATSQWPIFFSVFAGAVGLLGCGAAVIAHVSTSRDRSAIKDAETTLTSPEAWEGAHSTSEHDLSDWFRKSRIDPESGVADIIRACWSAWLGSRATTLTELHVLVARRERSKVPARLSAGIATLLLVIGIVGTLFSVKPILKTFQFRTSTPEGVMPATDAPVLSNVEESTELVNTLMHSLGDAFLPSLVALGFTIFVVGLRGIYSLGLHRYTLDLDRFAMGTVIPHYRPRSISDEYEEVRATFGSLAKTIGEREEKFDKVITQLTKFVDSMGPTLSVLDDGVTKMATAADALAVRSNSIATTLTRTLGKKSPLYAAVNGFEGIFERTRDQLDQLSKHVEEVSKNHDETRQQLLAALDQLASAVETIGRDHKEDRQTVSTTIAEVKALISDLPDQTIEATRDMLKGGLEEMKTNVANFLGEQKSEVTTSQKDLRDKTAAMLGTIKQTLVETGEAIAESTKTIPETLEKLDESLKRQAEVEKATLAAIRSVADAAESRISSDQSETEKAAIDAIRSVAEEAKLHIRNGQSASRWNPTEPAPATSHRPFPEPSGAAVPHRPDETQDRVPHSDDTPIETHDSIPDSGRSLNGVGHSSGNLADRAEGAEQWIETQDAHARDPGSYSSVPRPRIATDQSDACLPQLPPVQMESPQFSPAEADASNPTQSGTTKSRWSIKRLFGKS
jgi:hypothetical protein